MLTEVRDQMLRRVIKAVDAAATPHGVDRYLELVRPTWSSTEVRGRVTRVSRQTPNTVTLTIEANHNWRGFGAGQYTQLTVEVAGVRHTRCYSMANAPTEGRTIELTVKAHPGGVVSNYLVDEARPGMVVGLSPAQGQFVLPSERPERILLISGGSGITPVMSMLRALCAEGYDGTLTFVHYCLTEADLAYSRELEELSQQRPGLRLIRVFTDQPGRGDLDGFLSADQLDAIDPEWRSSETYLCGPPPLMDSARRIFAEGESDLSAQLHTEAFTLTNVMAEAGEAGGLVQFGRSGARVEADGRTLLELAESAGLRPAFGCRMGICQTCTCPLADGAVRNIVTGEVSASRGEPVRLCVSAPVGDVEIDL
jgi:ferredoxin-NADP reductase